MVSEISLLVQSKIATGICNLESDNRDDCSTTKRTLGWTESWGSLLDEVDATEECWKAEETGIDSLPREEASKLFPEIPLTILQYRPAWLEQLVLRIAGQPHIVVNSTYASNESTGPLPALRDLHVVAHGADSAASTATTIPILVGRRHPTLCVKKRVEDGAKTEDLAVMSNEDQSNINPSSTTMSQENSILEYLKAQKGVDLDAHLTSSSEEGGLSTSKLVLSKLLSLLITTKLQTSLMVLRYEDRNAWDQVYRKQCLQAGRSQPSTTTTKKNSKSISHRLPTMRSLYQAWSERVMGRKVLRLGNGSKEVSAEEAKMDARKAYEILEQQLKQIEGGRYLLDTTQPAMVDAILWAHLAEALCDVNLVMILVDFPLLVKYFQRMYDTYFTTTATATSSSSSEQKTEQWKVWNKHQNHKNNFQQIPLESDMTKEKDDPHKLKHALELMQKLSVRDHDLLEVLRIGKETRSLEWTTQDRRRPRQTPQPAAAEDAKKEPELSALEKARRLQQRHDQYWISLVAGVAILGGLSTLARMVTDEE